MKTELVESYDLNKIFRKYRYGMDREVYIDLLGNVYIFDYRRHDILKLNLMEDKEELMDFAHVVGEQRLFTRGIAVDIEQNVFVCFEGGGVPLINKVAKVNALGEVKNIYNLKNDMGVVKICADAFSRLFVVYIPGRGLSEPFRFIVTETYNAQGDLVGEVQCDETFHFHPRLVTAGKNADFYLSSSEHPYRVFKFHEQDAAFHVFTNKNYSENQNVYFDNTFDGKILTTATNFWLNGIAFDISRNLLFVHGSLNRDNFIDIWTEEGNLVSSNPHEGGPEDRPHRFFFDKEGFLYTFLNWRGQAIVNKYKLHLP